MNFVKRLYDWVLSWSESKWGALALFVLAFAESSFFPIPPDVLLIALCIGAVAKSFRFAAICLVGSVLGALAGYAIGHYAWTTADGSYTALASWCFEHIFTVEKFNDVKALYDKWDFWIVFTAGFTPIPYKLFTITGGLFGINLPMFVIASVVSRGLRFFLIAGLIWKFGPTIKTFIDKYFNWLAIAFTVLLIGAFVLVGKVL